MPIVATPDGKKINFPDGTPPEVMERVLREQFGGGEEQGGAADVAKSFFGGANEAIANTLGLPVDTVNAVLRAAGLPSSDKPFGGSQSIKGGMQALGIQNAPLEGTQGQRLAGAAGGGAGAGALFGPAAVIPGAVGGLTSGGIKEAGGGPIAQVAGGIAGGVAGAGAQNLAIKTGRALMGAAGTPRLEAMRAEGVKPRMVGDVTGSRTAQATTAGLQNAPITGNIIQTAAQNTTDDIAAAVERRAASFGAARTPTEAGQAIERGVQTYADRVSVIADKMYGRLRTYIPGVTPVTPTATQQVVSGLMQKMPGLPKTSTALTPSMFKNLADDLAQNATPSFEALSRMRTEVGKKLTDPWLIDDIGRGELKQLYGTLTDDLRATAANISPQALRQFNVSHAFYADKMKFLESAFQKLGRNNVSPETLFQWAVAEGKVGATRLGALKKAMSTDEFGLISSTVLRRMGTAGKDAAFDTNTFLREWEKISPSAKSALFDGRQWGGYRESVDRIAAIARDFRETGRLANTSRTAGTLKLLEWLSPGGLVGTALGGDVAGAATGIGVQLGGQAFVSKLLTSPKFATWLATPVGEAQLPKHIAALTQIVAEQPELADAVKEFTAFIAQQGGEQGKVQ